MKLLFICSAKIENGALRCASWISGLLGYLSPETEVTILSSDNVPECERTEVRLGDRTVGFLGAAGGDELVIQLKSLAPDAVVIFGTERPAHLRALNACREAGLPDRTAGFAQGIASACAAHYADGVPQSVIRRYTFRDLLRRQNLSDEIKAMQSAAECEHQMLSNLPHFIGRTSLDRSVYTKENPTGAYHRCNDLMRALFYEGAWSPDACTPHRIFISQFYYPIKGFHYLLEAAASLCDKYPDLTIAAAGYNPIRKPLPQNELKDTSYIRYIKSLIRRYRLESRIELLGELDEQVMKDQYLQSNVFVLPSTIENSPNSMAEAMLLGVPTIASDVGGVRDYATHEQDALICPPGDIGSLSKYIDAVFSDRQLASTLSENARQSARIAYDRAKNAADFEAIMRKVGG